jgi:cytochrome oxidase Cu insertion factor (SCO1/SenC/PrrC family)/copper(I)-binding protein
MPRVPLPPRRPAPPAVRLLAAVAITVLAACGGTERAPSAGAFRGAPAPAPLPKPSIVLTDTEGRPYDFREETAGRLTLLFFGYTHCPDVCPVQLANLAAVMRKLPSSVADRLAVVFVTVDPERDTPEVIRAWLDGFDRRFVGLRGSAEAIAAFESALSLAPSRVSVDPATGDTLVAHSSAVLVFPDDRLRLLYPFGTRQDDWARDLPRLLEAQWPADTAGAARFDVPPVTSGDLRISGAVIPAPAGRAMAAAYFTIENLGTIADTLRGVEAPTLGGVGMLHETAHQAGGTLTMRGVAEVVVPAGGSVRLAPGALHVMLPSPERTLAPGGTVPLLLTFARGGRVAVPARVVRYEDLPVVP